VSQSALGGVPAGLSKAEQEAARLGRQDGPRDRFGNQVCLGEGDYEDAAERDEGMERRGSGHLPDRGRPPDDPRQVADVLPELADR